MDVCLVLFDKVCRCRPDADPDADPDARDDRIPGPESQPSKSARASASMARRRSTGVAKSAIAAMLYPVPWLRVYSRMAPAAGINIHHHPLGKEIP
jgi:hypothetical protein